MHKRSCKDGAIDGGIHGGLRDPAQDLREDHSGISPRPAHGPHRKRGRNVAVALFHLGDGGFHGVRHIRAGIRIRHRKNVERIDFGAPMGKLAYSAVRPIAQSVSVQRAGV